MAHHQPIVEELIALLKWRPDLEDVLKASILKADRRKIATLPQYFDFLDEMVTLIPTDRNLNAIILEFYYLIDLSPGDVRTLAKAIEHLFNDGLIELVDPETGQAVLGFGNSRTFRREYHDFWTLQRLHWKRECARRGVPVLEVSTLDDPAEKLASFFNGRGKR